MITTAKVLEQALLSDVSYVDFPQGADPVQAMMAEGRFTSIEAQRFTEEYEVVDQFNDPSGFSGTLFRNRESGEYTFSARGSEGLFDDFINDWILTNAADIAADGIAISQSVAMFNYLLRLTATEGEAVPQYSYIPAIPPSTGGEDESQGSPARLVRQADATANGLLGIAAGFSVSGHSLGGHLAMVLGRLFPDRVEGVYTFNAPGFSNGLPPNALTSEGFFDLVRQVSSAVGTSFDISKIHHIDIPSDPVHQLLDRPGDATGRLIFSESENEGFGSHPIAAPVDSLAIYDLLARIDSNLVEFDSSQEVVAEVLRASAWKKKESLETILDALREIYLGSGQEVTKLECQESYWRHVFDLREHIQSASFASLLGLDADSLESLAKNGSDTFRYALSKGNAFVLAGADYSQHNQNGELADYQAATKTGALTDSWFEDRAKFLATKNEAFLADVNVLAGEENIHYVDLPGKHEIYVSTSPPDENGVLPPPSNPKRMVFGGRGSEGLVGLSADDRLYGSGGSDYLLGNRGDDYLEGGQGLDVYEYKAGTSAFFITGNDGDDTILDVDGKGLLRYTYSDTFGNEEIRVAAGVAIKESEGVWKSANGKFTYTKDGNDLVISFNGDAGGTVSVKDFREGNFGLHMIDAREAPVTTREIIGDLEIAEYETTLTTTALPTVGPESLAQPGRYVAWQEYEVTHPDNWSDTRMIDSADAVVSSTTDEQGVIHEIRRIITITYEHNRFDDIDNLERSEEPDEDYEDYFKDGAGNDYIETKGGDDVVEATRGGDDLIMAGDGHDWVEAGNGKDWVEGGEEADLLFGEGGDDVIYGGSSDLQQKPFEESVLDAEDAASVNEKGDLISGGAGDDWIIGDATNDLIGGSLGEDIVVAGAGDDVVYGDAAISTETFEWTVNRFIEKAGPIWNFHLGSEEIEVEDIENEGGKDVVYGGAGNDWVFAGIGDDYVELGSGDDSVLGEGGSDILLGGEGDDYLGGDSITSDNLNLYGDDFLDGGAGNDMLTGGKGNDILYGGSGDDSMVGGAGDDVLYGGTGEDILVGSEGKDTYIFNKGDGLEVILDTPADGSNEASVLVLGNGIEREDVKFRVGSLVVDLGDGDAIHFIDFESDDPFSSPVLDSIQFADGSFMTFQDVLDRGFDLDGTEGDDFLDGTTVTDRIDGKGGNDYISAGAGNDTILGGNGNDIIQADDGNDSVDAGAGDDYIEAGAGNDILNGGTGVDALIGGLGNDAIAGGDGNDELLADDGNDSLQGGAGDDQLEGGSGNDILNGGTGSDFMIGNDGSDVYLFQSGDGKDVIDEQGYIAMNLSDTEGTDVIRFAAGVERADVGLLRLSDGTLLIQYGVTDQIVVKNQYLGDTGAIERIEFADGSAIEKSELDALVVAPIDGTDGNDVLIGTDAGDTLRGFAGDDRMDGAGGNDYLQGGSGADKYDVYLGMGLDTVVDASGTFEETSTLNLRDGLTVDSLYAHRDGDDLLVGLRGKEEGILLKDYYLEGAPEQHWKIEDLDGTVTALSDLIARPDPYADELALQARENYKEGILSGWSGITHAAVQTPTSANLYRSWSQTVTTYIDPITQRRLVLTSDPVTTQSLNYFGTRKGNKYEPVFSDQYAFNITPVFVTQEVDDAEISVIGTPETDITEENHSVSLAPGGSMADRSQLEVNTYAVSATTFNTIYSTQGYVWVPILIDAGGPSIGNYTVTRVNDERVIEEINAGDGNNTIHGAVLENHVALIDAGGGDDTVYAGNLDFAYGGDGADTIVGGSLVYGGNHSDFLQGGKRMYGGAGQDVLDDGDYMAGGADDDYLFGRDGATHFFVDSADPGRDFIEDTGGISQLEFEDWYYASIGIDEPDENRYLGGMWGVVGSTGNDLAEAYHHGRDDEMVGIENEYYNGGGFSSDEWASLAYSSIADIRHDLGLLGLSYKAQDVRYIVPLPAAPVVTADNYEALEPLYADGIIELDVLEFGPGIYLDDISVHRDPTGQLEISWAPESSVVVKLAGEDDAIGTGIERFRFADGTVVGIGDMVDRITLVEPTPDSDTIAFTEASDIGAGLAGHDSLFGLGGNDILEGNEGQDFISGGQGSDFLIGGADADTLYAAGAADIIAFNAGDGSDTITAIDAFTLSLGGIAAGDLTLARDGDDFLLSAGDGDSIRITRQGEIDLQAWPGITLQIIGLNSIQTFDFTEIMAYYNAQLDLDPYLEEISLDGVLQQYLIDSSADMALGGAIAYQYALRGSYGFLPPETVASFLDSAEFGYEAQSISDGLANHDPVLLDPMEDTQARVGTLFEFQIPEDTFADLDIGDVLSYSASLADGNPLPDWLEFDESTRTFTGTPTGGDQGTVTIRVTATDAAEGSVSDVFDLVVADFDSEIDGTPDDDQLIGTSGFDFIKGYEGNDTLDGGDGNDRLVGGAGHDSIVAGLGEDVIEGGSGHDYLLGDAGDDLYLYAEGDGIDYVYDESGLDTLRLEDVLPEDVRVTRDSYSNLYVVFAEPGNYIQIGGWFDGNVIENIEFSNGTMWAPAEVESRVQSLPATEYGDILLGTDGDDDVDALSGDDAVYGLAGEDVLRGDEGADTLDGGAGADILIGGEGNDYLFDGEWGSFLDAGGGDDFVNGLGFIFGGTGNDYLQLFDDRSVVAYNAGDGLDVIQFYQSFTLSIGGVLDGSALSISGYEGGVALDVGEGDQIQLFAGLSEWMGIRLQIIDGLSVKTYDLSAAIAELFDQMSQDPESNVLSLGAALDDYLVSTSTTNAYGGRLAYEYSTQGSTGGLSAAEILNVLADPDFGVNAQLFDVADVNDAPVVAASDVALDVDQSVDASSLFLVSDPEDDEITQYEFWDSTDRAGSAHFEVQGVGQAANQSILVDASDLEDVSLVGGSVTGTDQLYVRAYDGELWSEWKAFSATTGSPAAPVVSVADAELGVDESVALDTLFDVEDANGDAIVGYEFWDGTDRDGSARFEIDGVAQGANQSVVVSAAGLGNVTVRGGSATGTDQLYVRAYDGQLWGAWQSFVLTTGDPVAPAVTVADQALDLNEEVGTAGLFSVFDQNGDTMTRYEFWDGTDRQGSAYFSIDGVAQTGNPVAVDAQDLGLVSLHGGTASGTDQLYVRAFDGQLWSEWASFVLTSGTPSGPVVSAEDQQIGVDAEVSVTELFTVTDANGDLPTRYEFWDSTDRADSAHFEIDGVAQSANTSILVEAADMADVTVQGGAATGTDQLYVRAYDGQLWSEWVSFVLTTGSPVAPEVSVGALSFDVEETVAAASLFDVSDANGDIMVRYEFWDATANTGSAHFEVDGIVQGANQSILVDAADLADTVLVAGSSTGTDQIYLRAFDGQLWSEWRSFNVITGTPVAPEVFTSSGQIAFDETVLASEFFSASDANGDGIAQYEFWDATSGGAQFEVEGVAQAVNQSIQVSASQLENTVIRGAAQAGTDQLYVRAYDGQLWSNWASFSLGSFPMFGTAGADELSGGSRADALQGLGGDDELTDAVGNNLLDGGSGEDTLAGKGLLIGGEDNDLVDLLSGANVIAFNDGDGQDTVDSGLSAGNTLSLGGGIDYAGLSLSRSGDDLLLKTGGSDQVALKDWYAGGGNKSVTTLQVIAEAMAGYNPGGGNTLLDNKIETFDFAALASAFDTAGQINNWALTEALLSAHLSGSDTAAMGGDLAYQYGLNGGLSGIGLIASQEVLKASQFSSTAQTLRPLQDLQQGNIVLA